MYLENTTTIYNNILGKRMELKCTPSKQEIEKFWGNVWESDNIHKRTATWIEKENKKNVKIKMMEQGKVTVPELKAPGIDEIQNFRLSQLQLTHQSAGYNNMIIEAENIPIWLNKGSTHRIAKE